MNDTRELEHGMALVHAAVERRAATDKEGYEIFRAGLAHPNFADSAVFAVSLSENGDLLSQWRAYAGDGAGYAIGFDAPSLQNLAADEWGTPGASQLVRAEYLESEQEKLAERLVDAAYQTIEPLKGHGCEPAWVSLGLANVLLAFAGTCKNSGFEEEKEWRLVYRFTPAHFPGPAPMARPKASFRAGRYGLTPFLNIAFQKSAVREITRGPKTSPHSEYALRSLLAQHAFPGWDTLPLPHAKASYR